jgi:hypothetical protein
MSRRDGVDPAAGTDAIPVFEQGIGLHREPELLVETAPAPLKRSPSRHPYRGVRKQPVGTRRHLRGVSIGHSPADAGQLDVGATLMQLSHS